MTKKRTKVFTQDLPDVRVDPELLAHLQDVFPNRLPTNMLDDLADYALMHGQQQVVRYIRMLYEKKP